MDEIKLIEEIYEALRDIHEGIEKILEFLEKLEPPKTGVHMTLTPREPQENQ